MHHARFETLKREIAAHATVDQLIDLEAQTARLLSERVSEALVARRAVDVAHDQKCPHCGGAKIVRHGPRPRRPATLPLPHDQRRQGVRTDLQCA